MPELPVGFGSTHLVVGVPAAGRLTTVRWGINLASVQYPMNMAVDYASAVDATGKQVHTVRNALAHYCLKSKAKLLWMVDDDVLPPQWAVQKLLDAMQKDPKAMCAAGIYYSKNFVPTPVVFEDNGSGSFTKWKKGEVFEVPGFIGTGCMLVNTEIFNLVPEPWFDTLEFPDKVTDDAYFCRKVIKAGYKILGHGGVLCGHYDHRSNQEIWPPED